MDMEDRILLYMSKYKEKLALSSGVDVKSENKTFEYSKILYIFGLQDHCKPDIIEHKACIKK